MRPVVVLPTWKLVKRKVWTEAIKKYRLLFIPLLILTLSACVAKLSTPMPTGDAQILAPETARPSATATPSPTPNYTPTQDAALMAEITLVFARATDTQVAIAKTEQAFADASKTQVAINAMLQATQDAHATQTQAAAAGATATQAYWNDVTATSLAATQSIEHAKQNAKLVGIWALLVLSLCGVVLLLAYLGSKVWGSWMQKKAEYLQNTKLEPDTNGRLPVIPTDAMSKNNRFVNLNLQHRAVLDPSKDDLTTEQALANTQSLRNLEATRAIAMSPVLLRKLTAGTKPSANGELPQANVDISRPANGLLTANNAIIKPDWSLVKNWDGQGGIPYGVSSQGLERVSIQQVPHGGILGVTGKGKSRYFLRPFIAGAIASGQRVVIMGKQADFWPFATHPNVKIIPVRHITQQDEAERYAEYLKRIVEEMNRRDDYLTSNHHSTWDRAGRENTLLILDELGNAIDMMPTDIAKEAYRWVQGLVKEGRKAGFNVWLATQRAVGFKSIMEQLGRAVFYLADADASRYALGFPGAETLQDGYFFAKFHGVRKCAAFDPSDDDLVSFLQNRDVKMHEPIDWIDGVIKEDVAPAQVEAKTPDVDDKIKTVLLRMKEHGTVSLSRVQREVYGDDDARGGKHFERVQAIWRDIQAAENATATQNNAATGQFSGSDTSIAAGSAA